MGHAIYALADMADCAVPSTEAGRDWLQLVEATFESGELDEQYPEDTISEWADGLVPIYTHELWAVFVDLAAYREDPAGELGWGGQDMTKGAQWALYMIAERLLHALWEEYSEPEGDDE